MHIYIYIYIISFSFSLSLYIHVYTIHDNMIYQVKYIAYKWNTTDFLFCLKSWIIFQLKFQNTMYATEMSGFFFNSTKISRTSKIYDGQISYKIAFPVPSNARVWNKLSSQTLQNF